MRFWNPSQHFHHFFNSLPARLNFQVLFFRRSSAKGICVMHDEHTYLRNL